MKNDECVRSTRQSALVVQLIESSFLLLIFRVGHNVKHNRHIIIKRNQYSSITRISNELNMNENNKNYYSTTNDIKLATIISPYMSNNV
jgi:hypothetical protein